MGARKDIHAGTCLWYVQIEGPNGERFDLGTVRVPAIRGADYAVQVAAKKFHIYADLVILR